MKMETKKRTSKGPQLKRKAGYEDDDADIDVARSRFKRMCISPTV